VKELVATAVAICLLWLADINDGRYSDVVKSAIVSLIGK
jgi:hypothetical protein